MFKSRDHIKHVLYLTNSSCIVSLTSFYVFIYKLHVFQMYAFVSD